MRTHETEPEPGQGDDTRSVRQPDEPTLALTGLRIASGYVRMRGPVKPDRPPKPKDYGETTGA